MPRPSPLLVCILAACSHLVKGLAVRTPGSSCGPTRGVKLGSPVSNATGEAICEELLRLPNYDGLPDPPAKRCNVKTGENCRAVLELGGAISDPAAGFSSTYGTYTINQLLLAEILGMIPYANYTGEQAGSYWERLRKGDDSPNNAWDYYFNPVSAYSPGDQRFAGLPRCKVSGELSRQLHSRQGWSVRSWSYGCERGRRYEEIMDRSRPLGARVVAQYYKARPEVYAAVEGMLGSGRRWGQQKVLGMHMRGTDKQNGRQIIDPDAYYPHALAFVEKYPGSLVYLATDDENFRNRALSWPSAVSSRLVAHPLFALARNTDAGRPFGGKKFRREEGFHALVDILALSKCDWLLHSISGLSEFAMYFNPKLQQRSTNLERNQTPSYNL